MGEGPEERDDGIAEGRSEQLLARLAALPEDHPDRERVTEELVAVWMPFIRSVSRRYIHGGEPIEDITQAGLMGLVKAINGFDPQVSEVFHPYAMLTIRGEIKKHFRDTTWTIRVSRRLQELRLDLRNIAAQFHHDHHRAPTARELAGLLDCTEEEIVEVLNAEAAYSPDSLDVPVGDDDASTVGDQIGFDEQEFLHLVDITALRPLMDELPPRERRILLLRFWGNKTQSQIAEEIGISQMHVSRLLSASLRRLRERLDGPAPDHA